MISGNTKISLDMEGSRVSKGTGGQARVEERDMYHHHRWVIRVRIIRGLLLHRRRVIDVPHSAGRDHLVFVPDPHSSLLSFFTHTTGLLLGLDCVAVDRETRDDPGWLSWPPVQF